MLLHELTGKKLGLCVSGGLDSRTVATRLQKAGCDVLCFTADLAQPDEQDITDILKKMAPTGTQTVLVDLKQEIAEACFLLVKTQAMYDGGYWNTTGMARAVTVRGLVQAMQAHGCTVLSHGATGRGNDQVRFERYTQILAPEMQVYAPWRDPQMLAQFPGRREMLGYLQSQGIEATNEGKKRYSTDANLAGVSHEAEDLEDLQTSCLIVQPVMGVWPQNAPDRIEMATIRFVKGRCVAINGTSVTPLDAMLKANELAGRNGVLCKNALENRIIGTKSRGVYEAPGLELLGYCLRVIYQATMDRRATLLFNSLSKFFADQVYDGRVFEPSAQASVAAIEVFAELATGTVEVGLYKGNMYFQALRDCPASIYNPADASMEASRGLNPQSAQGYLEVQSAEVLALARAGQVDAKYF